MTNITNNCVLVTLLTLLVLSYSEGSIYSSQMLKRGETQWTDVDLRHSAGKTISKRIHRSAPEADVPVPSVSEFDLKNDTSHNQALIHWSGNNSKVIFILTRKKTGTSSKKILESTLWRSEDYGKHYESMASAFHKDTVLKSYFISPSDKKKIIFVDASNSSKRIWRSQDEGKTYESVNVQFSVEKIDFHPDRSDWLLGYDSLNKELYCSMDFGKKWTILGKEVSSERYFWYVKNVDTGADAEKIVYFEYRHLYSSIINRIYKVKSCYIPDCTRTPFQRELDSLQNIDEDSLVVQDSYVIVQKSGAADKLYVSYKRGAFHQALFPFYAGRAQSHFHIISSDGECIIIGINHDNGMAHLFVSDPEGKKFRQSLSNVRYYNKKTSNNRVFTADIYEIRGIIGTYVANVHGLDGFNTTKISWDNCQSWSNITSNIADEQGKAPTICWSCSLNLHLSMEQTKSGYYMQSILAKKSYPGLIIAHGTIGRTVEDNPDNVKLFISKDNGKSWKIAKRKRHFVVVTNHGSVIVAVQMIFLKPVNEFAFSSDYGETWNTRSFSPQTVNVDGILTEPGESTLHLTLFGHKTYADSWKIFQINMEPLFSRNCSYPNDFENKTFPLQIKNCHLGMVQTIERRIGSHHCVIPPGSPLITTKKICNCSSKDYECDLGYKPSMVHGQLTCDKDRDGAVDEVRGIAEPEKDSYDEEKCIGGHKKIPTGFRKIPGDQCQNDLGSKWKKEPCHGNTQPTQPVTSTTVPQSNVRIRLMNTTENAKVGEVMIFVVEGTYNNVVWHVLPLHNATKAMLVEAGEGDKDFSFVPEEPGLYQVRAELNGTDFSSDWIPVKFWYPIERVYLFHPPVIPKEKPYMVTALTQTSYGLKGNDAILGEVEYTWIVKPADESKNDFLFSKSNKYLGKSLSTEESLSISVKAENSVSYQKASGKIQVKDFVVTLVMEMECHPANHTELNAIWLEEFRLETVNTLLTMPKFLETKEKYQLDDKIGFFLYVPPEEETLKVLMYFTPLIKTDSGDDLFQAAVGVENMVVEDGLEILLAHDMKVTLKRPYIIDSDGTIHYYLKATSGENGVVIAIVIVVVIIFIVIAVVVFRKVSRKMRFDQYFHFRNLRPGASGNSHIVNNTDRTGLVEEEFIDDELPDVVDTTLRFHETS